MLIDELLVGLGFEYDDKDIKSFSKDIDKTVSIVKNYQRPSSVSLPQLLA